MPPYGATRCGGQVTSATWLGEALLWEDVVAAVNNAQPMIRILRTSLKLLFMGLPPKDVVMVLRLRTLNIVLLAPENYLIH